MGRTIVVTRHAGAIELLKMLGIDGELFETLTKDDIATLGPADRVYGPLPVRLIAELTDRRVAYHAIDMVLDAAQRGRDLTPEEMRASGATPRRYAVHAIDDFPVGDLSGTANALPERVELRRRRWHSPVWLKTKAWFKTTMLVVVAAVALQIAKGVVDTGRDAFNAFVAGPSKLYQQIVAAVAALSDPVIVLQTSAKTAGVVAALLASVMATRYLSNRVLDASFKQVPVEPRRVLIQGLSPLKNHLELFEPFRTIDIRYSGLGKVELESKRNDLAARLAANPSDSASRLGLDQIARLDLALAKGMNWQQNLRSILKNARTLERIVLIPTQVSDRGGGKAEAEAFRFITTAILTRAGYDRITIEIVPDNPINYEDHDQVLGAIDQAMRALKRAGFEHGDITIDATAGLKVFSIAAAVATINSRALLTYVNNSGDVLAYDGRMTIADTER